MQLSRPESVSRVLALSWGLRVCSNKQSTSSSAMRRQFSCEARMSPLARVSSASSAVNGMMATFSPKCEATVVMTDVLPLPGMPWSRMLSLYGKAHCWYSALELRSCLWC